MTISIAIKLNGGAAGAPLSVAASAAITATLDSIDGVRTVTWSIASADDLSDPGDYTLVTSGIVDETCSFNALATLGTAGIIQAIANGDPTIYARAKFYVPSANTLETGADDEEFEGDSTHGTARLMNEAIRAAGTTAGVTATAPLASSGGLTPDISLTPGTAGQIIVTNAGATAGAWVSVSGDATLTSTGVVTTTKINGTSVNAGGALTTGTVLRATGAAAAQWGAVDLANASAVTGTLPKGNQAAQDMAGDVTGTTAASVVAKVNGTTVNAGGALSVGQVLRATGAAAAQWGAVDLADTDAVTGALPVGNVAPGAAAQAFITNAGGTAPAWVTVSGDATITAAGAVTVAKANGASVPAAGALTTGNVLQVSGASALSYSAVNLAGGANYVTGVLPVANVDATATPTANKIPIWGASIDLGAAYFYGGGTVATAGVLRTANNVTALSARNAANSGNVAGATISAADAWTFGDATNGASADVAAANFVRTMIGAAVGIHTTDKGTSFGMAPSFGSGSGVLGIVNRTTAPSANPTGGVIVSVAAGAPEVRSPNGVRTVLAPECNATSTQNDLDFIRKTVTTADATATVIAAYGDLPTNSQGIIEVRVGGIKQGTDSRCAYKVLASVGRAGAALSVDATDVQTIIDNIGVAAVPSVVANTNAFDIKVTGKAATDIDWHVDGRVIVYSK